MIGRRRLTAGAVVLILCGLYFVAEVVTASAWTTPYSYTGDLISDLGVTACVPHGPCSPWGALMNATLVAAGILTMIATTLLAPLVARPGLRWLLVLLAAIHSVGSAVVGLVPSAPGTADGTPPLHFYGAYAAIVGGNLALLVAGSGLDRAWTSTAFRRFTILLAVCGLSSGLALIATRTTLPGLLERGAADPITLWKVTAGLLLAAALARRSRRPLLTSDIE